MAKLTYCKLTIRWRIVPGCRYTPAVLYCRVHYERVLDGITTRLDLFLPYYNETNLFVSVILLAGQGHWCIYAATSLFSKLDRLACLILWKPPL